MAKALTTRAVEAARADKARREVPDGLVLGLYLVVQPSGARSWALRYRHDARPRKLTLGTVIDLAEAEAPEPIQGGPLTLAGARKLARAVLVEVAAGRDPAEERKAARVERQSGRDNFPAVAEQYISRHARPRNRRWLETARLLGLKPDPQSAEPAEKRPLIPTGKGPVKAWGTKRVQDVGKRDVVEVLDGMPPIAANRTLAHVRAMFNWAIGRGILEANPCTGIQRPGAERKRDRVLADDELRLLWQACEAIGLPFGPLVKTLLLTGCRLREVAEMEWRELDLEKGVWQLPAVRAKNAEAHAIALAPAVVDLLDAMPRIAKYPFVFSTNGTSPVSGFSRAKIRIDAAMVKAMQAEAAKADADPAEVEAPAGWTFHDLRRVVASGMARLGINLPVIEKCLAHKSGSFGGIVAVYQRHDFAEEQAKAWKAWAEFVLSLVEPRPSNVVPLRSAEA